MEYYLHTMKEEIKAVAQFSNNIRKKEQQALANGRKLLGIFSKKHQRDTPPPVAPQHQLPENPEIKAEEDYNRFWGLHRFRTHVLRKQNRHNFLAYGYLKGKSYREVEEKSREKGEPIDLYSVVVCIADHKDLKKYDLLEFEVANWLKAGKANFY